jgi:hypothetical protein
VCVFCDFGSSNTGHGSVVWRLSQDAVCLTCNREAARSIVICQHQQLAPPGLQQRFHHLQMPLQRTDPEAADSLFLVIIASSRPPTSSSASPPPRAAPSRGTSPRRQRRPKHASLAGSSMPPWMVRRGLLGWIARRVNSGEAGLLAGLLAARAAARSRQWLLFCVYLSPPSVCPASRCMIRKRTCASAYCSPTCIPVTPGLQRTSR